MPIFYLHPDPDHISINIVLLLLSNLAKIQKRAQFKSMKRLIRIFSACCDILFIFALFSEGEFDVERKCTQNFFVRKLRNVKCVLKKGIIYRPQDRYECSYLEVEIYTSALIQTADFVCSCLVSVYDFYAMTTNPQ